MFTVFDNRVTLTFDILDLRVDASRGHAMDYKCTKFDVDSYSRFPFKARTADRRAQRPMHTQSRSQTPLIILPTHLLYSRHWYISLIGVGLSQINIFHCYLG